MNRFLTVSLAASSLMVFTPLASAAVLIDWDFSDIGPDAGGTQPNPVLVALPSSEANAASGLSVTDMIGEGTLQYADSNDAADELNLLGWDGTGEAALGPSRGADGTPDGWLSFTLTADTPGTLDIDSISVSEYRNGGGAPPNIGFRVSVNGGAFSTYDIYKDDPATGTPFKTFTFNEAITGADSVEIEFVPVGSTTQRGDGNLHINALTVNGTIPEPASLALLGLGTLCLLGRRRG